MMLPRTAHELSLPGRPPRASCQLPSRRRRGSGDRPRLRARGGAAPARRDARRLISRPSYRGLAPARISRLVRLQGARGRRLPCSSLCMARSRPRSRSITCAGARRWPASDAPCACVTSPSPRCALRWRRPSPSCVCRRCPSSLRSSSLRRRCSPVWGWQRGGAAARMQLTFAAGVVLIALATLTAVSRVGTHRFLRASLGPWGLSHPR